MRRLSEKSLDELFDEEKKLLEKLKLGEEKDGFYYELVRVYEQIHHRLIRLPGKEREERRDDIDYVRKKLVRYLIDYGTYLKTELKKDDRVAKDSFKKALKYDPTNPVAHYRLGFLAYKERRYAEALHYFEKALQFKNDCPNKKYFLNEKQKYYAHLYLANSALFIAEKMYKSMNNLPEQIDKNQVPAEFSPLYEVLQGIETILKNRAFIKVNSNGETYCSKDECDEILENSPMNTVILYFSDRANELAFNGRVKELSKNDAEMLCYFLLNTNPNRPARKKDLKVFFGDPREVEEIRKNTFIQRVKRLRDKLKEIWLPPEIIETCNFRGETAYFYNGLFDYIIMYRSDYTFLFDDNV